MAKELLKDVQVRNAQPKHSQKPYRLSDGGNLYLHVAASGVKSWQLRYRFNGKPQTATLGKWPAVSLAEARDKARGALKRVEQGEHLTLAKREAKAKRKADAANTFQLVAADWVKREARRRRWTPDYRLEVEASLRNHLSELNPLPVSKITASTVAPLLRAVERRAPHMLAKIRPRLDAIFDFATEIGAILGNPLPRVRSAKIERRHFPAVTDLSGLGEILRAARASDPCKGVQRAHVLLVFTAQRVSEVVGATWPEFDLSAGIWSIPRARMKRKDEQRGPHLVPVPPGLLAMLKEWREADGEAAQMVCPAPRNEKTSITPEAVEKSYRDALHLGGKHSPHSWRSAFSTVCREAGKDGDSVEAQLDHVVGNKIASAYDRSKRLHLRRELMTWYEQVLISARDGAPVIDLSRQRRDRAAAANSTDNLR